MRKFIFILIIIIATDSETINFKSLDTPIQNLRRIRVSASTQTKDYDLTQASGRHSFADEIIRVYQNNNSAEYFQHLKFIVGYLQEHPLATDADLILYIFRNTIVAIEPQTADWPVGAYEGLVEFSQSFSELKANLIDANYWVQAHKQGLIRGEEWKLVEKVTRRVMVEIAITDPQIEESRRDKAHLFQRSDFNKKITYFNGNTLNSLYDQYPAGLGEMKHDLKTLPKNTSEWIKVISIPRMIEWEMIERGWFPLRNLREIIEICAAEYYLRTEGIIWNELSSEERYVLTYDFIADYPLDQKFESLKGNTLSGLKEYYIRKYPGRFREGGEFKLRQTIDVIPHAKAKLLLLLRSKKNEEFRIKMRWWEIDDNIELLYSLINDSDSNNVSQELGKDPLDLSRPVLTETDFRFLNGRRLKGLVQHFGGISGLRSRLIIPVMTQKIIERMRMGENIIWEKERKEIKKAMVVILFDYLSLNGRYPALKSLLDLTEPIYFKQPVPEFGYRSLESLLYSSPYLGDAKYLIGDIFSIPGIIEVDNTEYWLTRMQRGDSIPWKGPYAPTDRVCADLVRFLSDYLLKKYPNHEPKLDPWNLSDPKYFQEQVPTFGRHTLMGMLNNRFSGNPLLLIETLKPYWTPSSEG